MFLSDQTIKKYLKNKKIIIEPEVKDSNIRAVGIRAHLADQILVANPNQTIDLKDPAEVKYRKIDLNEEEYVLKPGGFILGSTKEKIHISRNLIAFIDGRSTIARLGLTVHLSSTTADGHYDEPRSITLEIANNGNLNIKLAAGYPIGMLTFSTLNGLVEQGVQSQYKGQTGATPPNLKFKTGQDL